MTPDSALSAVTSRFEYQSDKANLNRRDRWRIMRNETGPLIGDCEDFALTVLWFCCDKSILKFWWAILTFRAAIWYTVTDEGAGHVVLKYRGLWTDNIFPVWANDTWHKRRFPMIAPLLAIRMVI